MQPSHYSEPVRRLILRTIIIPKENSSILILQQSYWSYIFWNNKLPFRSTCLPQLTRLFRFLPTLSGCPITLKYLSNIMYHPTGCNLVREPKINANECSCLTRLIGNFNKIILSHYSPPTLAVCLSFLIISDNFLPNADPCTDLFNLLFRFHFLHPVHFHLDLHFYKLIVIVDWCVHHL